MHDHRNASEVEHVTSDGTTAMFVNRSILSVNIILAKALKRKLLIDKHAAALQRCRRLKHAAALQRWRRLKRKLLIAEHAAALQLTVNCTGSWVSTRSLCWKKHVSLADQMQKVHAVVVR